MSSAKAWLACALALTIGSAAAQGIEGHPGWPGAGQLFVGTNYQPFDRSREQIVRDIARMKQAGFDPWRRPVGAGRLTPSQRKISCAKR